jgi:hypothetical protein
VRADAQHVNPEGRARGVSNRHAAKRPSSGRWGAGVRSAAGRCGTLSSPPSLCGEAGGESDLPPRKCARPAQVRRTARPRGCHQMGLSARFFWSLALSSLFSYGVTAPASTSAPPQEVVDCRACRSTFHIGLSTCFTYVRSNLTAAESGGCGRLAVSQ